MKIDITINNKIKRKTYSQHFLLIPGLLHHTYPDSADFLHYNCEPESKEMYV